VPEVNFPFIQKKKLKNKEVGQTVWFPTYFTISSYICSAEEINGYRVGTI